MTDLLLYAFFGGILGGTVPMLVMAIRQEVILRRQFTEEGRAIAHEFPEMRRRPRD